MVKIIFHVGMHKTGTSTIQNTLYAQREELKKYSILYPETGLIYNEKDVGIRHAMSTWLFNNNHIKWKNIFLKSLISEIEHSECKTVILSYEAWSGWAWPSFEGLVQELYNEGYINIEIIAYIRNLDKFTISFYREFVRRRGLTKSFLEFSPNFLTVYNYTTVVSRMQSLTVNTKFYYFDNIKDVGEHFFSLLNIENLYLPNTRKNIGFSVVDCEIVRQLNLLDRSVDHLDGIKRYINESGLIIDSKKFSETTINGLVNFDQYQEELQEFNIFTEEELKDMFNTAPLNLPSIYVLSPAIKWFVNEYTS